MRPTVEDLQAIWRFTFSRSSLLDAANFLAELDKVAASPESFQRRALVEAAVVAYARPFTTCFLPPKRKKVVPLDGVPPPQHLAEFHDDALTLRNTMIGHKDATPTKGYTVTPNIVVVRIYPDADFEIRGTMLGRMPPATKSGLGELCAYFA